MNYPIIGNIIGRILMIEGLFMVPALGVSLYYGETAATGAFLSSIAVSLVIGVPFGLRKPKKRSIFTQDAFVSVGLAWVAVSLVGALPFFFSGDVPNYVDAVFETISGFTTTGASILPNVEALPMGLLYWRSFTHWLGGMGVLVFMLAIAPASQENGESLSIMQAETTGPTVGKLVPRLQKTAKILYIIYCSMTLVQIVLLLLGRMPLFDAVTLTFGTAGTGGFAIKLDSIAGYSVYCQAVITIFMALFGASFNLYYLILLGEGAKAFRNTEMRAYFGIMLGSSLLIALNILSSMDGFLQAFHHASFQVSSIMTTTGYATVDFNLWPEFSRLLLVMLMIVGASAGSTGGGIKVSRLLILLKSAYNAVGRIVHPNKIRVVQLDGETVEESVVANTQAFLVIYGALTIVSMLLVAILDNQSFETTTTAVMACINNVGPGLDAVGPMGSFGPLSNLSKIVLSLDMLFGRLEIFPMLLLFTPSVWKGSFRRIRGAVD